LDTPNDLILPSSTSSLDYLDSLLIHRPSPLMNPDEITDALKELVDEGKIKSFGEVPLKHPLFHQDSLMVKVYESINYLNNPHSNVVMNWRYSYHLAYVMTFKFYLNVVLSYHLKLKRLLMVIAMIKI
jgi:CMP-N-acetylneuraminic acid synthetase